MTHFSHLFFKSVRDVSKVSGGGSPEKRPYDVPLGQNGYVMQFERKLRVCGVGTFRILTSKC